MKKTYDSDKEPDPAKLSGSLFNAIVSNAKILNLFTIRSLKKTTTMFFYRSQ